MISPFHLTTFKGLEKMPKSLISPYLYLKLKFLRQNTKFCFPKQTFQGQALKLSLKITDEIWVFLVPSGRITASKISEQMKQKRS